MMGDNMDIGLLLAKAMGEKIDELKRTNALLMEALKAAQRALNVAPSFRVGDTTSHYIAAQVDTALKVGTLHGAEDTRETVPVPVPSGQDRFGVIYQRSMSRASRIQYFSVEDSSAHGLSFSDCHVMAKVIAEALNSQAKSGLFWFPKVKEGKNVP